PVLSSAAALLDRLFEHPVRMPSVVPLTQIIEFQNPYRSISEAKATGSDSCIRTAKRGHVALESI
ncbi:MAG: hypothetical protein AAB433_12590, partial [Nitrospirota bacterium]